MINKFELTKVEYSDKPQKVELTLSDAIHDVIMNPIKERWLVPVLQGETQKRSDGTTYYCFYLETDDAELLKSVFMQVYATVSGHKTPN